MDIDEDGNDIFITQNTPIPCNTDFKAAHMMLNIGDMYTNVEAINPRICYRNISWPEILDNLDN